MAILDLNTKIISDELKIWIVHPGRNRRFYETFLEQNLVFLELPGAGLNDAALGDIRSIRQHVRMSDAVKDYFMNDDNAQIPSRQPGDYENTKGDRSFNSAVGNVDRLFNRAKVGDLVLVAGYGQFSPVLMGEFTNRFRPNDTIRVDPFLFDDIHFRPVRWLKTNIERRTLPASIARNIVNRHAVSEISRNQFSEVIFNFAYDSFILRNTSKVDLEGPDYSGTKLFETHESQRLIAYLISAFAALERGDPDVIRNNDIQTLINTQLDRGLILKFDQEFHSPGKFGLYGATAALCAFVAGGVLLATTEIPWDQLMGQLEILNSQAAADAHETQQAADRINEFKNSLGADRVEEFRQLGQRTKDSVGLSVPSNIEEQ